MSHLVVDSSVVIKWFVVEPHAAEARRILTDYNVAGCLAVNQSSPLRWPARMTVPMIRIASAPSCASLRCGMM